jgi:hypothetical protein
LSAPWPREGNLAAPLGNANDVYMTTTKAAMRPLSPYLSDISEDSGQGVNLF